MKFELTKYLPASAKLDDLRKGHAGGSAPGENFESLEEFLRARNDFRAPPSYHQAFGLMVYVHEDLAQEKSWKLLVDELSRLLAPGGLLILRYKENPLLSGYELKSFLLGWAKGRVLLEAESREPDGTFLSTFRFTHSEKRKVTASDWTFGILTNGSRPENLERFIDSVNAVRSLKNFEILVNGPRVELGTRARSVRFIEPPTKFAREGWITKKKNEIVAAAQFSNVLVAHDRYFLTEDFLERMEEFGGDFDVLTVRQETLSGLRFPDWVSSGAAWQVTPVGLLDYDDYSPYTYVNGGLILAKTAVLKSVPWNEMLFWAQTEDVELSRRLEAAGFSHRLARKVILKTTERPEYVLTFPKLPILKHRYVLPARVNTLPFSYHDGVSLSHGAQNKHGLLARLISSVLKQERLRAMAKAKIAQFKPQIISLRVRLYERCPRLAKRLDRLAQALYFEIK